ncbi:MAG: hypothetical protein DI629_18750 [Mesorhizobium amorphae]|nr:MAG: hypothetical protein DI629_18750 [Mesorhizobium amorphae]
MAGKISYGSWSAWRDEVFREASESLPEIISRLTGARFVEHAGYVMCCCPFHEERNPSFSVQPGKGYRCFTNGCGASGNVMKFMREHQGVSDPRQAILMLASLLGKAPPKGFAEYRGGSSWRPSAAPRRAPAAQPMPVVMAPDCDLGERMGVRVPRGFRPAIAGQTFRYMPPVTRGGRPWRAVPEMVHVYRDLDGWPLLMVLRVLDAKRGKKSFRQVMTLPACPGTPEHMVRNGLCWRQADGQARMRKPLYGMGDAISRLRENGGRVLVVEGEKCVDRLSAVLTAPDDPLVVSFLGGSESCIYADWTMLAEACAEAGIGSVEMTVWPDNDGVLVRKDGVSVDTRELMMMRVSLAASRDLARWGVPVGVSFRITPEAPAGAEKGWDGADAVEEGWTADEIRARMIIPAYEFSPSPERVDPVAESHSASEAEAGPSCFQESPS